MRIFDSIFGAVVFGSAMVLGGCAAVGPSFTPPLSEAPTRWDKWHGGSASLSPSASPPGAAPGTPGSPFDDPVLAKLQARALAANADLQTAAIRFAQSRFQETTVAAQHGVQVNSRAAVARQRQSESGAQTRLLDAIAPNNREQLVGVLSDPFNLYQAGFDASWELDLWGRVRRAVEAAEANTAAAAATLRQVKWAVSAEVARRYFELRGIQASVRLARSDLAAGAESLTLLSAKAQGGLIDETEPSRQRAQVAELRAAVPALLDQEAQAINQLTLLSGARPGTLNEELAEKANETEIGTPPDLALGVPSEFARHRPDIAAAEARLHAATAAIGVAAADLYPRITLGASFGLESTSAGRFGDWGSRQWSVGPSLSLPIFDHGRRTATVTLRELEQQEAAVAYQHVVLEAWHEIDSAVSSYTAERQRRLETIEQVRNSSDALALAAARYRYGLTDFLPQLDAERALIRARRAAADSMSRVSLDWVRVHKALGDTTSADPSSRSRSPGD